MDLEVTSVSPGGPGEHGSTLCVRRSDELGEWDGTRYPVISSYWIEGQRLEPGEALPELSGRVLVDISRCGMAFVAGLGGRCRPYVVIGSPGVPTATRGAVHVDRQDLLSTFNQVLSNGQLKAAPKALGDQLAALRGEKQDDERPKGFRFSERTDDMVIAAALGLYYLSKRASRLKQPPGPRIPFKVEPLHYRDLKKVMGA